MSKQRIGAQVTDIFQPTMPSKYDKVEERKSKTSVPVSKINVNVEKKLVKSTVTLDNSQICWLDRLSSDIRSNNVAIVDRGSIIRGILMAVEKSGLDLTKSVSETDIYECILKRIGD